jgi:hypothetical protein
LVIFRMVWDHIGDVGKFVIQVLFQILEQQATEMPVRKA